MFSSSSFSSSGGKTTKTESWRATGRLSSPADASIGVFKTKSWRNLQKLRSGIYLVGGFKHFLFSALFREDSHFD